MADNRPTNYDDFPLVLDMKEMQKVLGKARSFTEDIRFSGGWPATW